MNSKSLSLPILSSSQSLNHPPPSPHLSPHLQTPCSQRLAGSLRKRNRGATAELLDPSLVSLWPRPPLMVVGVNFRSASLELRERLTQALLQEQCLPKFHGAIVLSTCNRCELYFETKKEAGRRMESWRAHEALPSLWRETLLSDPKVLYTFRGQEALTHLLRLLSGLDSALVGETQITGQVKRAYEEALERGRGLDSSIHFFFQRAQREARLLRQKLALPVHALEPLIAAKIAPYRSLCLIGPSLTHEALLEHLDHASLLRDRAIALVHRSRTKRSDQLKLRFPHLRHLSWEQIEAWKEYEVVSVATKAPHYLPTFSKSLKDPKDFKEHSDRDAPKLYLDLSIPRNIPQEIADHSSSELLNIEDLTVQAPLQQESTYLKQQDSALARAASHVAHLWQRQGLRRAFYWAKSRSKS